MTTAYQVAIELKEPLLQDEGRPYREFLDAIDTSNPHATGMPSVVGNYDKERHAFYALTTRDDADAFAQKARDTGLVKEVHIDEW